jgi:phage shock protein A
VSALSSPTNLHVQDSSRRLAPLKGQRSPQAADQPHVGTDVTDLLERVHKLRSLLPAFAQDTAVARREAAGLRSENAKLRRRMAELEAQQSARTTQFGASGAGGQIVGHDHADPVHESRELPM